MTEKAHGAFVFTDLAGFTAYTSTEGDAAALALVERFEQEVRSTLRPGARVVKQLGDGLFLWFADVPSALESIAALMSRCRVATEHGIPLWVRTGVHTGAALRRGDDLLGHDVNVASRITGLAGAGETLVSAAARNAADASTAFEPVGPSFLKGIQEPVRLFRLVPATRPTATSTAPPF